MITLAADCLIFQLANGESIPFSSDMISVDLAGETGKWFDESFVQDAAKAVFHYFKHEKGRETISVGEFAEALEKVLGGFAEAAELPRESSPGPEIGEADLARLAHDSGEGWELFFYRRLREELRARARNRPEVLRFRNLRQCVKQLLGARRWGGRCRTLEEQILSYLRECLTAEVSSGTCSLLVR